MSDKSVDIEFLLHSDEFRQQGEEIDRALRGMSATSAQEMQKIGNDLDVFRDRVRQAQEMVGELEKGYAASAGSQQRSIGEALGAARGALAADQALYADIKGRAEVAADANLRLSARLDGLRNSMENLQKAGQGNSGAFGAMEKEAGAVGEALEETKQQLAEIGQQSGILKGIVEGMEGVAGVAGVAQNAMALFGNENEEVARVLTRLQAIQGMAVGVQQAAAAVYKESAFQVQVVSRAKKAWAVSTQFLNTQLGISAGLSKALMTGGVGLLIAGVGMLAYKLLGLKEEADVAGESMKGAMDAAAVSYGKLKMELDAYVAVLHDEGAALADKMKAQKYLEDHVPGYLAVLDKEGKLVRENTDALKSYNDTLMERAMLSSLAAEQAKAMAVFGEKARKYDAAESAVAGREASNKSNNINEGDWQNSRSATTTMVTAPTRSGLGLLKDKRDDAKKEFEAARTVVEKLKAEEDNIRGMLGKIEQDFKDKNTSIGAEVARLEEQLKNLDHQYASFDSAGKSNREIEQEQNRVNGEKAGIQKRLDALKLKDKPAAKEDTQRGAGDVEGDLNKVILANQMQLERERLAIMQDGRAKRLLESELEHKQREEAIRKDQDGLLKQYQAAGKSDMPDEDKMVFTKRFVQNDEAKIQRDSDIGKAFDREVAGRAKSLTEVLLTEEQRRAAATKERYDKEREWAKQNIADPGKQKDYLAKVDGAQQHDETFGLLEKYKTYAQERLEIEKKYDADLKTLRQAEADPESIALAEKEKQDALGQLDATMVAKDGQFKSMLGRITTMSMKELKQALAEAENALAAMEADGGGSSQQAAVERAKLNALQQQITQQGNTGQWKDTLEIMEKTRTTVDGIVKSFDGLSEAAKAALSAASNISGGVIAMITNIQKLSIVGVNAVKGVERASVILAVISAALQITMALFNLFNKDKKNEKKIKELQKEADNLSRSYEKLGKTMENTYSDKVYGLMDDHQENLKQQQEVLRKQIEEEKGKKKTDDGKVEAWEKQIEDLDAKMAENERKRMEMLAGTDVKSAISTFSDALVEAYAVGGEKGSQILADTTKKMMANAVKGALEKKFLGDAVEKAVKYLGEAMEDGILTDQEQSTFEELMKKGGDQYTQGMKAYNSLFKGAEGEDLKSASGQIQAQLTEQTGSEFLGLTRVQVDIVRRNRDINEEILLLERAETQNMAEVLRNQLLIQENTKRTADNTDGLRDELKGIRTSLQKMETRGGVWYGK